MTEITIPDYMKPEAIQERVQRGANFLDERMPGWADQITIHELDISSTCGCIVGQLFSGDFSGGIRALHGEVNIDPWTDEIDNGFEAGVCYDDDNDLPSSRDEYEVLTDAWLREIERRLS